MAIEFDCPHCGHHYRLKDELAGKAAACKNCRKKIVIPQPVTIPDDTPLPGPAVDVEAAALAALSDAPDAKPDTAKQINVECNFCGHKWTEPITRAGKNMLCLNMECRQRIKIPEPKDEGQYDWRQTRTTGPSLAKDQQPKLEGVQDAADVTQLSSKTLQEKVIEIEYEPRPFKQKMMFVLVPLLFVAGVSFGIRSCIVSRTEGKEDKLMQEAHEEFAKSTDAMPKEEVPLLTALLHIAGGEYTLRRDTKEDLTKAMDHFAKAQAVLRDAGNSPARNAAVVELAIVLSALGGTEEQAREQIRIRWTPELGLKTRPNERVFTVYEELRGLLSMVQSTTDMDFRTYFSRRLTRELVKRGQANMAIDLIPLALFNMTERAEAKALVALEIYRADNSSELPRKVAGELAAEGSELSQAKPPAASARTLFLILNMDKVPTGISTPGTGSILESQRLAYAGLAMLESKEPDALSLATRAGRPEEQLRSLVLCAEWATDPTSALDKALGLVNVNKKGKDSPFSPYLLLRLAQIAAFAGKFEQANQFAESLPDESSVAWAKGDAVRWRLLAAPSEKGDASWIEAPDDAKKLRAGQAWGRMWVARQNTHISKNRSEEVKAVSMWPTPVVPFGKAGIALGIQDQDN